MYNGQLMQLTVLLLYIILCQSQLLSIPVSYYIFFARASITLLTWSQVILTQKVDCGLHSLT